MERGGHRLNIFTDKEDKDKKNQSRIPDSTVIQLPDKCFIKKTIVGNEFSDSIIETRMFVKTFSETVATLNQI